MDDFKNGFFNKDGCVLLLAKDACSFNLDCEVFLGGGDAVYFSADAYNIDPAAAINGLLACGCSLLTVSGEEKIINKDYVVFKSAVNTEICFLTQRLLSGDALPLADGINKHYFKALTLLLKREGLKYRSAFLRAKDYIDNNFLTIKSIAAASDAIGVSVFYLSRNFTQRLGVTASKYLAERKIEYSKTLLDKGATVTDTARQCGFSSASYFLKTFKQQTGTTAGAYKKYKN